MVGGTERHLKCFIKAKDPVTSVTFSGNVNIQ